MYVCVVLFSELQFFEHECRDCCWREGGIEHFSLFTVQTVHCSLNLNFKLEFEADGLDDRLLIDSR